MSSLRPDGGSFRDPSGRVLVGDGDAVYRTIAPRAAAAFDAAESSGLLDALVEREWLVPFERVPHEAVGDAAAGASAVLRHPRLPVVSYPYEWPFGALKAAALLHLDVQLAALDRDVGLSDATAYNVQFRGARPVFIDHLSFRPYRDGEYWRAHGQFCEQFLNPLLFTACTGVAHHAWFRGRLDGVETEELARLLPGRSVLRPAVALNVTLPAWLQRRAAKTGAGGAAHAAERGMQRRGLPRAAFRRMLEGLRGTVAGLEPGRSVRPGVWSSYAGDNSYSDAGRAAKRAFVERFVADVRPALLLDIGCNVGEHSGTALAAGASLAVGLETDAETVDAAFARAVEQDLAFLPLRVDAADPSPAQGWRHRERPSFEERVRADAVLALAVVHHLCIARNIPVADAVDWLLARAPQGIVEVVPKCDPMVGELLRLRDDVFDDYGEESLLAAIAERAEIVDELRVPDGGRRLVRYRRGG